MKNAVGCFHRDSTFAGLKKGLAADPRKPRKLNRRKKLRRKGRQWAT
jgi:hypothetical protein